MLALIFLSGLWTSTDSTTYIGHSELQRDYSSTPTSMAYFVDPDSEAVNVTSQLGGTVHLHCRVSRLPGDTSVSWLRRQDGQLRLVAVGLELYSSDHRYSVRLLEPGDWQLRLRALQESDQGHYECQVPSHPPRVHSIYLNVVVPELEITDERDVPIYDKFYNLGSTIQLKCRLTRVPRPAQFLLWRHGTDILNYDHSRGGISVRTDLTEDGAWSRLLVAHATSQDSGNYSCVHADIAAAFVTVHVLKGETPAAMQRGGSPHHNPVYWWAILLTLPLLRR